MHKPLRPFALSKWKTFCECRTQTILHLPNSSKACKVLCRMLGVQSWPLDAVAEVLVCKQRVTASNLLMRHEAGLNCSTAYENGALLQPLQGHGSCKGEEHMLFKQRRPSAEPGGPQKKLTVSYAMRSSSEATSCSFTCCSSFFQSRSILHITHTQQSRSTPGRSHANMHSCKFVAAFD